MDANRVRLTSVKEVTLGVTPTTPRMRKARFTGESLKFRPEYILSQEIRDDRMNSDPIKVDESNTGAINGELSYPAADSPLAAWFESMMFNDWVNTPTRDNDGTADSVISNVANTTDVVTVTAGAPFVAPSLVLFSGFGIVGNNGLKKVTTGSATAPAFLGAGFTVETAPPATARMKTVGLEGASGDITALADGLGSTATNWTLFGLKVGQWINIGGATTGQKFATAADNGWARITAISATKLTLDNLPVGWTTDTGTGKTIRVWFGDTLVNGVTQRSSTIERGFMSQGVPTYIAQTGMTVGQASFEFATKDIAKYSFTFSGMTGTQGTVSLDDLPDTESTNAIMAAAVNVGRIAENGSPVSGPNWIRSLTLNVNNNLRMIDAIRSDGVVGAVDIGEGSFDVSASLSTYFGSNAQLSKFFSGAATNINLRIAKGSQAIVFGLPRVTFSDGDTPSAGAKNTDVLLALTANASKDTLTGAHLMIDRLEFFET